MTINCQEKWQQISKDTQVIEIEKRLKRLHQDQRSKFKILAACNATIF